MAASRLRCLALLLTLSSILAGFPVWGQNPSPERGQKKIEIKQADRGYYSKASRKNRLIGNVVFEHEGALMYCDSAWLFSADNRLQAFQNVRINQGDTLFLYGDRLRYSGATRLAVVTGDTVKLQDPEMTLYTDRLEFDRNQSVAYYLTGGRILNGENTLTSGKGYYRSTEKLFNFKDSVVLINPDYRIESDTLDYNSASKKAYFLGPSTITSDSSFIYCENGVYNTVVDVAQFEKNALVYDGDTYLTGDSLYYEKRSRFGEAFGHVLIHDTVDHYLITGDYGQYRGQQDSAFVTGNALFSQVDEEGDTLHVHGDTLYSVQGQDSLGRDYRLMRVFYGVAFYQPALQGKCDSLSYLSSDSTYRMYNNPVLWDDSTQISGDTIYLRTRNNAPDTLLVFKNAFMISRIDSSKANQVSGQRMTGTFRNKELWRVYVNGNGQTLYYPEEENGGYIGMNRSLCANLLIYLQNSAVQKITFLKKPEGKLYPLSQAPPDQRLLPGYLSRFAERPRNRKDLLVDD